MSKSKNTKDEQQKDLCITSEQLTEQWKKGELSEGFYYFKLPNGEIDTGTDFKLATLLMCKDGDKIEVIEKVPSYDELQNMNKAVNECMAANIKLVEQNKQLKGLLKEVRQQITNQVFGSPKLQLFEGTFDNELLAKIDQLLGADR